MDFKHILTVVFKTVLSQWDVYSDIANGYNYLQSENVNRTFHPAWYPDGVPDGCYLDEDINNGTMLLGEDSSKNETMHCTERDVVWGFSSIALVQAPMLLGGGYIISFVLSNQLLMYSSWYRSWICPRISLQLIPVLGALAFQVIPYPLMVLAVQIFYLVKPKYKVVGWTLEGMIVTLISLEAAAEAGPQALLQLYIIFSDHEREWKLFTLISLASSMITIAKASISQFGLESPGVEEQLSAGESSAVVSFYTSTIRFLPIFITSFIFRTTATCITFILFRQWGFIPLAAGAIIITILSLMLNKKPPHVDDLLNRSIVALSTGFSGFAVLTPSFWAPRSGTRNPLMISSIVWLAIHSITLLVITIMITLPQYHLQHWKNIARIPFLKEEYRYIFYVTMGIVVFFGLLNVILVWFQIFIVDWTDLNKDVTRQMRWIRGEEYEKPPEIGCVEPYLRKLEKKMLKSWVSFKKQPLTCICNKVALYLNNVTLACKSMFQKSLCSTGTGDIENNREEPESSQLIKNKDDNVCTIQALKFVSCSSGEIPLNAFPVKLYEGETFFVAQAMHEGSILPGYLVPSKKQVFVSWGMEGIEKDEYSVLVQAPGDNNLYWADATKGSLESLSAVGVGKTPYGDTIYLGRAQVDNDWCVGKVTSQHNSCFIGSQERSWRAMCMGRNSLEEYEVKKYQVLCSKATANHNIAEFNYSNSMMEKETGGDVYSDGDRYSNIDGYYDEDRYSNIYGEDGDGMEMGPLSTDMSIKFVAASGGSVPHNAFPGGKDGSGETLYIGRAMQKEMEEETGGDVYSDGDRYSDINGYYDEDGGDGDGMEIGPLSTDMSIKFVAASGGSVPHNAFPGGKDGSGETLYIGRAMHAGSKLPGKLHPSHGVVYVSWEGKEHAKTDYEVLVQKEGVDNISWIDVTKGSDLETIGAIQSGQESDGSVLYVARARICNQWTVGRVSSKYELSYIPYGGKEHKRSQYQVLCTKDSINYAKAEGYFTNDDDFYGDSIRKEYLKITFENKKWQGMKIVGDANVPRGKLSFQTVGSLSSHDDITEETTAEIQVRVETLNDEAFFWKDGAFVRYDASFDKWFISRRGSSSYFSRVHESQARAAAKNPDHL